MIDIILKMLEITESKHENIQILKGKYELKLSVKESLKQIKEFRP